MEKFGFLKKNLQDKGPNIAKEKKLNALLEKKDGAVNKETFEAGLKAATDSKHATDKILAMMGLRSMISKKGDGKIIHITFPLNKKDEDKIKDIPSSCFHLSGEDFETMSTTINKFIESYEDLGRLAKAKISWVIAKMHNREQLATLAHDTAKKLSEARKEVPAILKFIQANPIVESNSAIIGAIINKNRKNTEDYRVYTLNVAQFKANVSSTNGVSLPVKFQTALELYNDISAPFPKAFKSGLPAHGNKKIEDYNKALKELMEEGTIGGNYPAQTGAERLSDQIQKDEKDELTNAQTTFKKNLDLISTAMNDLIKLSNMTKTDIEKMAQHLNENGLSPYPQNEDTNITLNATVDFLNKMLENLKKFEYDECIKMLNRKDLRNDWQLCFAKYIEKQKELKQPILTQWHKFSGQISSITDSAKLEQARVDTLKHEAFEDLNGAFKLLGKALDGKTCKEKATQLGKAKAAIPEKIEAGSEKIAKSEIEAIFDKIVKIPTPEKQWEEFCRYVSNINKSDTLKASIEHFLVDDAFKTLKDGAFDLLGKALDETGAGKADKIKAAKAAIPAKIEAGKKEIGKSAIEDIFDKIMKQKGPDVSSDTGTGKFPTGPSGLPFDINTPPTKKATKRDKKGSAGNAQPKWQNGINPGKVRKGINPEAVQKGIELGAGRTGTTTGNSQK